MELKAQPKNKSVMKDLRAAKKILGTNIERERVNGILHLSQK